LNVELSVIVTTFYMIKLSIKNITVC